MTQRPAVLDGVLLAVGTLSAVRVPAPSRIDRRVAGYAMSLAPLAVVALGAVVTGIGLLGREWDVPAYATAVLAVAALALGTRILHIDGLSDVADGLTASYDPARSLEVMRGGTSGPAGVVATVLVIGLQVAALGPLLSSTGGALAAGIAVCAARGALAIGCVAGVASARTDGLGATVAGTVPRLVVVLVWLAVAAVLWLPAGWSGPLAATLAAAAVGLVLHRCVARFGGITGDVLGACVEIAFAVLVLVLAAGMR